MHDLRTPVGHGSKRPPNMIARPLVRSVVIIGVRMESGQRNARVLAFVAAHPDDDIMGVAGLIALHRHDPELRFVLVHATDGEAGQIAPGSGATRETLGRLRREEDRRSWEVIGRVPDRHEWLGFPDGEVAALPPGVLTALIADIFAEERTDVLITSGPDGITGHPDHIAVGAAASEAFTQFAGSGRGFKRLFHAAYPQSALARANARRIATGRQPWNPSELYHPRGSRTTTSTAP